MKQIKKRLTYANVMSSIAVFLVLGGATAIAASQLGKNSVGSKQLKKNAVTKAKIKKNAVTSAKIKKNAVTGAKIRNGAVDGAKVADGSLTGADINAASTSFSQIVARLRNPGPINLQPGSPIPLGGYTQAPNQDDQYFAGLDVTFAASCAPPRQAAVYLLMDPVNPAAPSEENLVGLGIVSDETGGTVTKRLNIAQYVLFFNGMQRMGGSTPQGHSFYFYPVSVECDTGSGITGSNLGLDVIGTK